MMYCKQKVSCLNYTYVSTKLWLDKKLRGKDSSRLCGRHVEKAWAPSTTSLLKLSVNEFPLDDV